MVLYCSHKTVYIVARFYIFIFVIPHLSAISDNKCCLIVVLLYVCLKQLICLVLLSFPEKLLVRYYSILCGNLLLNASCIVIQVCNLTSWNIGDMLTS